jgi:hypothetical protein
MPEIVKIILAALGMFGIYGSGLTIWPVHRLRHRRRTQRGRGLFWLFIAQLTLYVLLGICALTISLHGGSWIEGLVFVWPLNAVFVALGCGACMSSERGTATEVKNVS